MILIKLIGIYNKLLGNIILVLSSPALLARYMNLFQLMYLVKKEACIREDLGFNFGWNTDYTELFCGSS